MTKKPQPTPLSFGTTSKTYSTNIPIYGGTATTTSGTFLSGSYTSTGNWTTFNEEPQLPKGVRKTTVVVDGEWYDSYRLEGEKDIDVLKRIVKGLEK